MQGRSCAERVDIAQDDGKDAVSRHVLQQVVVNDTDKKDIQVRLSEYLASGRTSFRITNL